MSFLGLSSVTLGVPDPAAVGDYYERFGLSRVGELTFGTATDSAQLRLVEAPFRRATEVVLAVDDPEDLDGIAKRLDAGGFASVVSSDVAAVDPATGVRFVARHHPLIRATGGPRPPANRPGTTERPNARAQAPLNTGPPSVLRLGHVVVGSTQPERTVSLLADGFGMKVSDQVAGGVMSFLRCSIDHHNLLVMQAPVSYAHHTAWEVEDIDEIARGATNILHETPEAHVWGLGRHQLGSNYFWYLRDPAGNFAEYYADMDCITDDQAWRALDLASPRDLRDWPPPPREFVRPPDLAALVSAQS